MKGSRLRLRLRSRSKNQDPLSENVKFLSKTGTGNQVKLARSLDEIDHHIASERYEVTYDMSWTTSQELRARTKNGIS